MAISDDSENIARFSDDDDAFIRDSRISHPLPGLVTRTLRKHFYYGVKHAEVRFKFHAADEDSVTGALGNDLAEPEPIEIRANDEVYLLRTTYYKIRGRGPNAPEGALGADGIFQFEVLDQRFGRVIVRKGLLFQSKIRWTGRDGRLLEQARNLAARSPSAIVIDYSERGYWAFAASDVVAADGNRRRITRANNKTLAEVLGDEFIGCRRGDPGVWWDPEKEGLIVRDRASDLVPARFIGTTVVRVR